MSSVTDPIGDLFTRIRNAYRAAKEEVSLPSSKMKVRLVEILKNEGFLDDFSVVPDRQQNLLVIRLRYSDEGLSAIRGLRRESRPGRRIYVNGTKLPRIRNGLGTAILSTSQGVMTDRDARKAGVGGEHICSVW